VRAARRAARAAAKEDAALMEEYRVNVVPAELRAWQTQQMEPAEVAKRKVATAKVAAKAARAAAAARPAAVKRAFGLAIFMHRMAAKEALVISWLMKEQVR